MKIPTKTLMYGLAAGILGYVAWPYVKKFFVYPTVTVLPPAVRRIPIAVTQQTDMSDGGY